MDIAGRWRALHPDPADAPRPGVQVAAAADGITVSVTQQCQVALPPSSFLADEVTVTVTSHRPGVGAQVTVGANFNSVDGSYQGPTTQVGQGQFTATSGQVQVGFVVLPAAWPVLGVGAGAVWDDGEPESFDLTYVALMCRWRWWWIWLIRAVDLLSPRQIRATTGSLSRRLRRDRGAGG